MPPRTRIFNAGFLTSRRIRRILALAGQTPTLGWPRATDTIAVWGDSPTATRGRAIAARTGSALLTVEDAFLRSVLPGRAGDPPLGLLIDRTGVHFDPRQPSDIETLLAAHPLDDPALLARARSAIDWLCRSDLSKYNAHDPALAPPAPGFVLLIDQTRGDASLRASGATRTTFLALLARARADHPNRPLVVKSHPETTAGLRPGHIGPADIRAGETLLTAPLSPHRLLAGAHAVYAVSSQLAFEAILAGHRPILAGSPFFAGWGLTDDPAPLPRRGRPLSPEQLFAAAMILYPTWYDPSADRLTDIETAIAHLEAETRAWRDDHHGWVATGMRLWKRKPLASFLGTRRAPRFADPPPRAAALATVTGRPLLAWATRCPENLTATRVEDGFLRSRGLGADLVPPLSLCLDDKGIYYDPTRPSRLEALITEATTLPPAALERAGRLVDTLTSARLSKYNLAARTMPALPPGHRILVPGQVEDDASIRLGAGTIRTNRDLLQAVRAAHPDAVLLYKPHPDVEAALRPGIVLDADRIADAVLTRTDPIAAIDAVDEIWTITSTLGFEALLRGKPVTCAGMPFYAGWGLTTDLVAAPARRVARPTVTALAHAALIAYPRYMDPVTRRPCPPETAILRLAAGGPTRPGPLNRALARMQGRLASYAHLWRRP
jgi:capsular polysaccharide export protein